MLEAGKRKLRRWRGLAICHVVRCSLGISCYALGKLQVLFMNGKSKTVNLSKFGMVYYNNLLSLPICLPIAIMKGEFPQVLHSELLHGPDAQGFIACAVFSGAKRRVH